MGADTNEFNLEGMCFHTQKKKVISEILLLTSIKFIHFFRDFEEDYSSGHVYDVIENHVGGSSGIVKIIFNHEDVCTAMQTRCRFRDTDITTRWVVMMGAAGRSPQWVRTASTHY